MQEKDNIVHMSVRELSLADRHLSGMQVQDNLVRMSVRELSLADRHLSGMQEKDNLVRMSVCELSRQIDTSRVYSRRTILFACLFANCPGG